MDGLIKVGMADLNTSCCPGILTTLGLGSCVGIALYDHKNKVAGLAHIMLPSSSISKNIINEAKFADTAVIRLVEEMRKLGARKEYIVAKLAGGAQMFSFNQSNDIMKIGQRNIMASKEELKRLKIPVIAEDTGGNYGRTIELYSDDGILLIKTIGYSIKQV